MVSSRAASAAVGHSLEMRSRLEYDHGGGEELGWSPERMCRVAASFRPLDAFRPKKRHVDPSEAASRANASATHWSPRLLQAEAPGGFLRQGRASGRQTRPVPWTQRLRLDVREGAINAMSGQ